MLPQTAVEWWLAMNHEQAAEYAQKALKLQWQAQSQEELNVAKAIVLASAWITHYQSDERKLASFLDHAAINTHVQGWKEILATTPRDVAKGKANVVKAALLLYESHIRQHEASAPVGPVAATVTSLLEHHIKRNCGAFDPEEGRHYLWGAIGFGLPMPFVSKKVRQRIGKLHSALKIRYDKENKTFTFANLRLAQELVALARLLYPRQTLFGECGELGRIAPVPPVTELDAALQRLRQEQGS